MCTLAGQKDTPMCPVVYSLGTLLCHEHYVVSFLYRNILLMDVLGCVVCRLFQYI